MNKVSFPKTSFLFSAAVLVVLTGCVGYVDRPGEAVYVEPAPVVIEQDDYVYYPGYQMYYGTRSHRYYYQEGRSWVARPAPRGVSVSVLATMPSVSVDFHDRPSAHHAEVIRSYPRDWKPARREEVRPEGHREDHRDERREDRK